MHFSGKPGRRYTRPLEVDLHPYRDKNICTSALINKESEDVLLYRDIGKREPVKSESTQSGSYFSTAILFLGLTVVRLDLRHILYFSY